MLPCVILAGGLGTRMISEWPDRPKNLIPVADAPFAHWQLSRLRDEGVTDVIYSIGFKGQMIRDYVGDGSRWGLSVTYVDEGDAKLGTGGALRLALEQGVLPDAFFVLWGDSYLDCNYAAVAEAFHLSGLPALMTVFKNNGQWDKSNVVYRDQRVVRYDKGTSPEGAPEMLWIDYGLSVLTKTLVEEATSLSDLADLMRDLSKRGELAGFEVKKRFHEIGSIAGLQELESFITQGTAFP